MDFDYKKVVYECVSLKEEDYNFKAKEYYNNSLRYIVNNSSDMIKNFIKLIRYK